jgi:Flp pilus assembly pilin Flp
MKKIIEKGRLLSAKARYFAQNFGQDESGMGTVEVVLIIVVLIGLVMVFKDQIDGIIEDVFRTIKADTRVITG